MGSEMQREGTNSAEKETIVKEEQLSVDHGLPMEVFLIMINIVLFSSDNVVIENRKEVENNQIYYMLMLHRYLNELFGKDCARLKLSKIMGVLVELRELCERSKEEELQRIKMENVTE